MCLILANRYGNVFFNLQMIEFRSSRAYFEVRQPDSNVFVFSHCHTELYVTPRKNWMVYVSVRPPPTVREEEVLCSWIKECPFWNQTH